MKLVIILILSLVLLVHHAPAQDNDINEFTTLKYDNALNFGPLLHTNGLGINFKYLKSLTVNSNLVFSLDIHNMKHPKETKVVNPIYDDAKRYVYGRINTAFPINAGIGSQFIIADKERFSGIRLSGNFVLGTTLTLLKPEFLKIIYYDEDIERFFYIDEKYDPSNAHHVNQANTHGGTSFFTGFNELNATIGLFGKAYLTFEWNESDDLFQALETGVMIHAYPEALPLMAFIDNKFVLINLFANLSMGRRW